MMKQSQREEMLLTQKLNPRQIMLIKLLQIPTVMMEQRINEELESNPALEEVDEEPSSMNEEENMLNTERYEENSDESRNTDLVEEYFSREYDNYDGPSMKPRDDDEERRSFMENSQVSNETYQENLLAQLDLLMLSAEDRKIANFIVGSIDEDGYIQRSSAELAIDMLFAMNISTTEENVEKLIKNVVQRLEPAGIGARDLRECLLIQLERIEPKTNIISLAKQIVADHYDEFTKKRFDRIKKNLACSDEDFHSAIDFITKNLNPKPGEGTFVATGAASIVPDFEVVVDEREQTLELLMPNIKLPRLRLSKQYESMYDELKNNEHIAQKERDEAMEFVRQKVNAAQWFIEALSQRETTLYKTMTSIMEHQKEFFLTGDEMMLKPMILNDIAKEIEVDVSTISRVVKEKYVLTQYGTIPLKFFFSESITTVEGDDVSTRKIKKIIKDAIDEESKDNPLTDQALCDMLIEKGYHVARRTVAKYREQLGIPVARMRK
ncbi:MAG: RNA polymerase factor sigma-54 [Bacteroidales bacterium]|nr:RNA polymerase factor sigma-54 [Bacteroidales bacterium]